MCIFDLEWNLHKLFENLCLRFKFFCADYYAKEEFLIKTKQTPLYSSYLFFAGR